MGWVPFQLLYLGPFSNVRCSIFFGLFVLIAFLLFGNACYHIGLGQARQQLEEIKHMKAVELPASTEKQPITTFDDI